MNPLYWVTIGVVMCPEPHCGDPWIALKDRQGLLNEPAGVELPVVFHVKDVFIRDVGVSHIDRLDLPYVFLVGKDEKLRGLKDLELVNQTLDDGVRVHVP